MTAANVHGARHCAQAIRSSKPNGSAEDNVACARWHRQLNSLNSELFKRLELIGWYELTSAAKRINNHQYPRSLDGATKLRSDLLSICDYLEELVQKYGTDPESWEPGLADVQLAHASRSQSGETAHSTINRNSSKTELVKRIRELEKELKDRRWLDDTTGPRQRRTFLAIIVGMAIAKYGFDPSKLRSSAARTISDATCDSIIFVNQRTVGDFLKRGSLLYQGDDRGNDDWPDE